MEIYLQEEKFQSLTETFRFLGLTEENDVLTPLGKRFVFGRDDSALVVGLIQSEYFRLFHKLVKSSESLEKLFDRLSLECGALAPEKQRRSMSKTFTDLSTSAGLLEISNGKVGLSSEGINKVKTHYKIPLWALDMPLFAESQRIELFKKLYYETGHPLRDIIKDAFSELGFEAKILPKKTRVFLIL